MAAPSDAAPPLLAGARIQEVRQPAPTDFALLTYRPGHGAATWLLSAHPLGARLIQTFAAGKNAPRPGQFLLWLRTRLAGGLIEAMDGAEGRLVTLTVRQPDAAYRLVLEVNGRESNVLLLDDQDRVLAALHGAAAEVPYAPPTRWQRQEPGGLPRLPAQDEVAARALDAQWRERIAALEFEEARAGALRRLKSGAARLHKRLEHIAADLAAGSDAERLREQAELLQIHRAALRPGLAELTVPDEFAPGRPPVTIALDPAAGTQGNIDRLYRAYRKAKDGAAHVQRRHAETSAELARLERLRAQAEAAADPAAWGALLGGLEESARRLLAPPRAARRESQPRAGVLTRVSADGYAIFVGRSKEENDEVTFKIGRGRDWWLHALGVPGAHVIVRNPQDGPLPPATLRQAAWLAAYYSKGRAQGQLEVTCTQRKHVRKVKGGEPGQVTHALGRTFWVDLADPRGRAVLGEGEPPELEPGGGAG